MKNVAAIAVILVVTNAVVSHVAAIVAGAIIHVVLQVDVEDFHLED